MLCCSVSQCRASAAILGAADIADIAGNVAAALPHVKETVGDVAGIVNEAANNLIGAAGGIAGKIPIVGPLVEQLLGTVLGLLGVVLGIAQQLPLQAASGAVHAST